MLMPLVAIVAMALPLSASAQDSCTIRIVGEDSYGDGWNGGTVTVTQSGSTVATFTLSSGDSDSTTVTVTNAPLTITWTAGSYDGEVTLWIYHSSGVLLYSATQPTAGTLLSMSAPCSACFAPAGVGADSLASDAAHIAWSGAAASYGYLWGTVADMADGIGTSGSTSSTSLDLTGLTSGTGYTVKVWSECSGETSDTVTYTFATLGDAVSVFPYSTGFEADDDIAWTFVNDATNKWFIGAGAASTGTNGLYISNDNGTTNAYTNSGTQFSYAYRVLSVDAATQFSVTFDWMCNGEGSYDYLRAWIAPATAVSDLTAGYSPDGGTSAYNYTTATPAGWIDLGGKMNLSSSWQTAFATPSVAAGNYIFVFMWANDGSSGSNPPAAVDNISITPLTCPAPSALTIDSVTTTEIMLSWIGGNESTWELSLNDSIVEISSNPYTVDNLSINTPYTIKVRAICGADDTSFWSDPVVTRTLAGEPLTVPYFCGFELTDDGNQATDWVLENGSQANYWIVDTAVNNGGSRSLYITNDGMSNGYNTSSTSYVFAYATFYLVPGEYAYSYDWHAYGESSFDFIRAAVVPSSVEFTAGNYCGFNSTNAVPAGGIAIDGAYRLNLQGSWQNQSGSFTIADAGAYKMVFMWRNDGSGGTMPPAAIDNVQLVLNTCPAPVFDLAASYVTSDSIVAVWSAGGTETAWQLSINGELTEEVTDTTYIFDNLNANTVYNVSVRGICGPEDTSMWTSLTVRTDCGLLTAEAMPMVEDFENQSTTSSSNNNFIPCWAKLNDATSTYYPYVSNSTSYNHTDGGSKGIYWYSTGTTSYGTYRSIVLPGVDTTSVPMNNMMLTFWAKPSSTGYNVTFQVGVLTDPTADSTFQNYQTITLPSSSTAWAKYTVMFNNYTGYGNYIALRETYGGSYWYAYLDDFTLDQIPPCAAVEDLSVNAGPASAMVSWTVVGNDYDGAVVEYKEESADSWNTLSVTGVNYTALTGLAANTTYNVRVAASCDEYNSSSVSAVFSTTDFACAVMDPTTSHFDTVVGTSTITSYQRPVNNFYRNTFSEQIYDSTELGGAGTIVAFSFNYGYSTPMTDKTNCMVYMAQTPLSTISSSNYVSPENMTLVYTGSLNCVNGWNEFTMSSPFNYTGGNLVVAVVDNSNEYDGSAYVWNGHSATGKSFSFYSDSYTYPNTGSMSTNTDAFRPHMTFSMVTCIQQTTCAAPLPTVTGVTSNSINLAWAPGNTETSWNVYYRMAGEDSWSAPIAVTATNYTVTGLNSGRNYEFKVENNCSGESYANTVSATTECAAITLPFTENFNTWGSGSGILPNCWKRTGSYSSYPYILSSYNHGAGNGGSLYMYQSGTYHSAIFMPMLDTTLYQANQTQLVFHVMNSSADYLHSGFEVGVLSDPNDVTTFVPVDTVYHTVNANVWEIFEVPLNAYTGNGAYVGFRTTDNPNSGTTYTYSYFYVDDMTLELIPTCPRPDSLTAGNSTTSSVDLGWHERGGASQWIIEYGPRGFQLGTGTTMTVNSNPFTLTGLPNSYQGEYYVKSICGAGDTGDYSRMACPFGTLQIPATLPYNYDFENVAEWNNWQTSTNHETNNWYRGNSVADSGSYAMYIATGDAAAYGDYSFNAVVNAAAYRDIDFGPVDSSYTLSFRARVGGTTTASYDGLMVFLVDPSIATVASSQNITSPWGNVNDLYRIANVRLDTTWQTYEASFDTISGIHRVAFFWFNQSTASYANIPQPAAVDNIHIRYSSCVRPVNVEVNPGSTTAHVTWQGASDGNYEVIYRQYPGVYTNSYVNTATNSITLTGLESNSQYAVWVRKVCGVGDTSLTSDGILFTTTMCEGGTEATNFDPNASATTSSYSPIGYSLYNNSYVQTIVDSADLAALNGDITAFGFLPTVTTGGDYFTNMTVYMANVPESTLTDFIHPDSTDHVFVKVIDSANFNYTEAEWQIHNLDNAFTWDGHSNLLVAVTREHGSWTSGATFSAHTASGTKMVYDYDDNSAFDVNTASGGTTSSTVGDIRLISCGAFVPCTDPVINLTATVANENDVTISFSGDAMQYEVGYVQGNTWVESATTVTIADTFYTFTGLTAETQYTFGVRALCSETNLSNWSTVTLTTLEHPCFTPTNVAVSNATYDGATVTWYPGEAETEWEVNISCTSPVYNQTFTVSGTPQYVATGLDEGVTYKVAVRGVCAPGRYSDWSDTVDLATMGCDVVTGLTKTSGDAHSVTISWTSTGASKYEVDYGDQGHTDGNGTIVETTTNSVTINGLESESTYDIYVRQYCTDEVYSQWSSMLRITTDAEQGIDDVESARVTLYPNPASQMVTIGGIEGEATVSIVDMNGREVYSTNSASESLTLDLTGYAKGAYFVRITGERTQAIRKLIVK